MNYEIGICELYNRFMHGPGIDEDKIIVSFIITNEEFFMNDYLDYLTLMRDSYNVLPERFKVNNILQNYKNIIENKEYYRCNLIKSYIDEDEGYMSCVIKTGGLVWFQKRWKKIFKKRKELLIKMKNLKQLRNREITGYNN